MSKINIEGLSKAAVIKALYDNSIPVGVSNREDCSPEEMSWGEAERLAQKNYLGYIHCRYMKCSFHFKAVIVDDGYDSLALREKDMNEARSMGFTNVPRRAADVIAELRKKC